MMFYVVRGAAHFMHRMKRKSERQAALRTLDPEIKISIPSPCRSAASLVLALALLRGSGQLSCERLACGKEFL